MIKCSYEDFKEWSINFTEKFIKDICTFLELTSIPSISITDSYIENRKNIHGMYMIDNYIYDGYQVRGRGLNKEKVVDELIQSITISLPSIYNKYSNSIQIKLTFIHTLVHEMTHFYQFKTNRYVGYYAPSYKESRKERQANRKAKQYKKERLIKITPFLFI